MPFASRRALLRLSLATLLPAVTWPRGATARPQAGPEMRGLWATRSWMTSPGHVTQLVDDAARHGLTSIFVQVRGRGDAFYQGGPDPRSALLARQAPGFDPLGDLVARARARGLQVHAWLNVNLVAGATAMPTAAQHVAVQHPEWLMVPRSLAATLLRMSPRDPRYASTLAAWSHKQKATIEGVFSSPLLDGAQDRLDTLIDHLTSRYALDGVHLDYIRFPSPDFDCSRAALEAFRTSMAVELTPGELAGLDARAKDTPLAFIDAYAARWTSWRRERLTHLVTRLGATARRNRPGLRLSAAVWPDPDHARDYKLQDWSRWLRDGLIDAACPMLYMASGTSYERQLQVLAAAPGVVWPGIGAYKIEAAETARRVEVARTRGFGGVLLYSYDSMTGGEGRPSSYLAAVQRQVFRAGAASQLGATR